jgi:microcystin-dependent protein
MPVSRFFGDNIAEQSSTIGVGDYELDGALTGYRAFSDDFDAGETPYYAVRNVNESKYEYNKGTTTFTPGTPSELVRDVWLSSNANSAVAWDADDLPLTVYIPTSGEVMEAIVRGFLATTRNALQSFGIWFKQDHIATDKHVMRLWDGTQDIDIGWVDGVNHTAVIFAQPPGTVLDYMGCDTVTPPPGYLFPLGQNVSRTTYAALFAALTRSATVTMTIASPCVVTWTAHPLNNGDKVSFETTGALPTGLSVGTNYFVINKATNTFNVSATFGGAAINTSGSQSGVHTCRHNPHGCGNGTTTFTLPDTGGRVVAGREATATRLTNASSGIEGNIVGHAGGTQTHTLTTAQIPSHTHSAGSLTAANHAHTASGAGLVGNNLINGTSRAVGTGDGTNSGYFQDIAVTVNGSGTLAVSGSTGSAGSDGAHPNAQPTIVANKIIATGGVL